MRLVALDPGRTAGWAMLDSNGHSCGQVPMEALWAFLDTVVLTQWNLPENTVTSHYLDMLICENDTRMHVVSDFAVYKCCGIIEEWARQNNVKLHSQGPDQAKFFWTNDRLREYHLYESGKPHAMDARRHLMYYLHFVMKKPLMRSDA